MVLGLEKLLITKDVREGDENVLYLNCGDDYMGMDICQNSLNLLLIVHFMVYKLCHNKVD